MQIINLIGHIGRDAETKHIGERDYISFSVACTEKRGNEENTSWYSILYPYQEAIIPFLKKGQQVFVMGKLSAKIYQSNNSFGIDLSVFASTLQLCGGKKEESTTSNQATYGSTVAPSAGTNAVPSSSTAKPATVPEPSLTAFGNYAQENMTSPFPPPVDENGNEKSDDLPFNLRGAAV